jgi:hypothetical protein
MVGMRAIAKLARRQLGLITRAQALQLVTKSQVQTLVANGHLEVRRRGVLAIPGAPPTYEQAVLAATMAAAPWAYASHRTAAKLHGLLVPAPTAIDVLTLPNRRLHLDGVAQHRAMRLPHADLTKVGPIPVTGVARTLIDCLPFLPGPRFRRAVDDARRRKLVTYEELEAAHGELDRGQRTGRHLVVPARPVVADRYDAGGSERELDVLHTLRAAGLPAPVQQFSIVVAGRQRYLDYAYPDELVYIEFKGFSEHGEIRSVFDDDAEREAELALLGWVGIPVTSNTVPSDLIDRVRRALTARAA